MSATRISRFLESSGFQQGGLLQTVAGHLLAASTQNSIRPLLLLGAWRQEAPQITQQLHSLAQTFLPLNGSLEEVDARALLQTLSTDNGDALKAHRGQTLHLKDLDRCSALEYRKLTQVMNRSETLQNGELFIVGTLSKHADSQHWQESTDSFFAEVVDLKPLYERNNDIDGLVCRWVQEIIDFEDYDRVHCFSLESITHIHRAVLQTRRTSDELYSLLEKVLYKSEHTQMPVHDGCLMTWPIVRLLEEEWGYSLRQSSSEQALHEYNFEERFFSASLEQASCLSGFSRELIQSHCQLMLQMIDDLPEHQKNYQGLTSRLDQLNWLCMKLVSSARTQSEMRDFFGFGSKGKIPKATTKLKFDQYRLDLYGAGPSDPQPWNTPNTPLHVLQHPSPEAEVTEEPVLNQTPRTQLSVSGEMRETLFWRHQDILAVLAADSLDKKQISGLLQKRDRETEKILHTLIKEGLLLESKGLYSVPADDMYMMHSSTQIRFVEDNLLRYLSAAFHNNPTTLIDNFALLLPEGGLPELREEVLNPFLHEDLMPLSDNDPQPADCDYSKKMYALLMLGTDRHSPLVHGRLPLQERVLHYFREATLQRANVQQRNRAICLQATMMLSPQRASLSFKKTQELRKELKRFQPQGRGKKTNFNMTLCLTEVPMNFFRDVPNLG